MSRRLWFAVFAAALAGGGCNGSGTAAADVPPKADAADVADAQEAPDAADATPDRLSDVFPEADAAPAADLAGEETEVLPTPPACNPLDAAWDCLLPFPSDVFLVTDATLPGGRRVAIPQAALPARVADGVAVDFLASHPADGFSHASQILVLFPGGVDASNLVFHTGDVTLSRDPSSPTLLLEADTGRAVMHFAEPDPMAATDARRALIIRPLERLRDGARYVVAIHGLKDGSGNPVAPPDGFARLRDGTAAGDPVVGPLAARYESGVFPVIATFGVARADLQLAWDFTTATEANVTGDLLRARSLALDALAATPPVVTVTGVTEPLDATIQRRIDGTLRVPMFLESADPGAALHRDASGAVAQNGVVEVPFLILVPATVITGIAAGPARVIQYGHGFFGHFDNLSELGLLYPLLGPSRVVLVSSPWWGMTADDLTSVMDDMANSTSDTFRFTDRVHQAMVIRIAMAVALKGPLTQEPSLQSGGAPLYDPATLAFYGISEGAILGGTYAALAPYEDRVVLGSGGAALSFIMPRSTDFAPFLTMIQDVLQDPVSVQAFMTLSQSVFDRVDPITYAPHVLSDTLPGSPSARRLLFQAGIGDAQVPNLAAHLEAAALGLKHLVPATQEIAGMDDVASPYDGSAIAEYDFGISPPVGVLAEPPAQGNAVHEAVRQLGVAVQQVDAFLEPGAPITSFCAGPCDPD